MFFPVHCIPDGRWFAHAYTRRIERPPPSALACPLGFDVLTFLGRVSFRSRPGGGGLSPTFSSARAAVPRSLSRSPPPSHTAARVQAASALMHEFTAAQLDTARSLVPWFLRSMPSSYFRQVPEATRLEHLKVTVKNASPLTKPEIRLPPFCLERPVHRAHDASPRHLF